jgi:hypothetical protein
MIARGVMTKKTVETSYITVYSEIPVTLIFKKSTNMTQPNDTATSPPVSTVTKHITIYSDNPIHDCIDRIIDAVAVIDEGGNFPGLASLELHAASQQLLMLATDRIVRMNIESLRQVNRGKPD